jgi:prophage DNA circulation protein
MPAEHQLDPIIEVLTEMSSAVRAVSSEFKEGMARLTKSVNVLNDNVNVLNGRLDGQSLASQDLAREIRSFVTDKERLKGRVIMLEELEHARREANGKNDA